VASPGPGNHCARFLCFGHIHPVWHPVWHPAWFLDVHRLVRKRTEKITLPLARSFTLALNTSFGSGWTRLSPSTSPALYQNPEIGLSGIQRQIKLLENANSLRMQIRRPLVKP